MNLITVIRAHPRVEHVEDQRSDGRGIVITLRQGFTFDRGTDTRTHCEKTLGGALAAVKLAYRFGEPRAQNS